MTSYLKIKDNVDLEELEKLKFENRYGEYWYWTLDSKLVVLSCEQNKRICIFHDDEDYGVDNEVMTMLYNLIQAGLVEKVVEQ